MTLLLAVVSPTAASAAPHAPATERVSTAVDGSQADGSSGEAAISADGRHVAFVSRAASFGCAEFTPCLLEKDLGTGEVTRIDLGSGYQYGSPMLSADGSRVAFSAGTGSWRRTFYDRATGRAERLWPENPPGSNELGRAQSISPDGTHVAYTIGNRAGSSNFRLLYVRDTATGTDTLVSPAEEGDKNGVSVSGDGQKVAYGTRSDSETDPADVFVRDRQTGERTQVDQGLGVAYLVRITADGNRVLLDAEGGLYVHDLRTGTSRRVAEGRTQAATADGRYAVVAGEDGTRVRDLRTGLRGADLAPYAIPGEEGLAAGGRAVAFASDASHLVTGDTNKAADVFVFSGGLGREPGPDAVRHRTDQHDAGRTAARHRVPRPGHGGRTDRVLHVGRQRVRQRVRQGLPGQLQHPETLGRGHTLHQRAHDRLRRTARDRRCPRGLRP
ncbi:WD40 repeat domain-containing protein [Streptomyces sp. L7]